MQLPGFTANASISSTGHNYEMGGAPLAPAGGAKVVAQHSSYLLNTCPVERCGPCFDGYRYRYCYFGCPRWRGGHHWHKVICRYR